jgi:hypothetical protein
MSTSSGYVVAGYELERLEFWWWYAWAVRTRWRMPFRQAMRTWRHPRREGDEQWAIDL